MPERPTPTPIPERPKTAKDDIQLWGALAIAFAALASRRTRTPMTTALNAAGAALNGMREGDKDRADQAYKEWQENTKLAFQMADYEQRAYEDIIHDRDHVDELRLKTLMASLEDAPALSVYQQKLQETGDPQAATKAVADFKMQQKKQADN